MKETPNEHLKEFLKIRQKEKEQNDSILKWLDDRNEQELKTLAFLTAKLLIQKGETFEDIEKMLVMSKIAAEIAKEKLNNS